MQGKMENLEIPPIGIIPSRIWKEERLSELYASVTRFRIRGRRPKTVWLEEIDSLEKELEASDVLSETTNEMNGDKE